jgi:hypothetical protein
MLQQTQKNKPINLFELSAGKYKIGLDKSSESKYIALANRWDLLIKCVNGEIYPFSSKLLAFHCVKRIIRNRLHEDYPKIEVRNWSDRGEAIFLFEPKDFNLIEKYAAPRKIRRLSEKHKTILAKAGSEALKAYRNTNSKTQILVTSQTITS